MNCVLNWINPQIQLTFTLFNTCFEDNINFLNDLVIKT